MHATSASLVRVRRGLIPSRGGAWRPRKPAKIATTLLDSKRQQMEADAAAAVAETAESDEIDAQQPVEAPAEDSAPSRRGMITKFRLMAFPDSDESEESDYEPSEDEEVAEGDDVSVEELVEQYEGEEETAESEEMEEDADSRWWKSSADKRRWEKRYRQADAVFRKRFGCAIDTPALPEMRRRLRKEKTRHCAYKFALAGLVIAFLVQLVLVYSTSSWAFSMVAWQSTTEEKESSGGGGETLPATDSITHRDAALKTTGPSSQHQVPEHVRTGLHLCSTLSRRVLKSEHDVAATQHAVRACDIAVKFAPLKSREAIEAHALRGDLRSLLSRFDSADEDYKAAITLVREVESSGGYPRLALELSEALELKLTANRWTQLYKNKRFKDLRREAKDRAADAASSGEGTVNEVSELAGDWLRAFKGKKPVLEVLTLQRSWTLRRLKYEALDDDDNTKPDVT